MNIPTLDGPNWGQFSIHLQAAACILDVWEVIQGEILTPAPNPTYNLLTKPTHLGAQASAVDLATYMYCCKGHLEQKECTGIRSHAGHNITSHMARLCLIWQGERIVGYLRDTFQKGGGEPQLTVPF